MKPSLIVCHIKHCLYPIWMRTLRKYRDFFGEIIIHFSEHNRQPYFDHYIHSQLNDLGITFLDQAPINWSDQDWRDVATKEMLKHSKSDWIVSIEQDWLVRDWDKFLNMCTENMKLCDLFGWMNPSQKPYIHPACFFAKRDVIEKSGADFSPHSEITGSDHFAMITYKAMEQGAFIKALPVGKVSFDTNAFHLGGVNQNFLDGLNSGVFHRPDIFYVYNWWSLKVEGDLPSEFVKQSIRIHEVLKKSMPDIDLDSHEWSIFFK